MSAGRTEPPAPTDWPTDQLRKLIDSLESIRSEMAGLESVLSERGRDIHPSQIPSAANLMHYVALRRHDVRQIQEQLAILGLSSLGRAESHVLGAIDAVLRVLYRMADGDREPPTGRAGSSGERTWALSSRSRRAGPSRCSPTCSSRRCAPPSSA